MTQPSGTAKTNRGMPGIITLGCTAISDVLNHLADHRGDVFDDIDHGRGDVLGRLTDPIHGVLCRVADIVPEVVPIAHAAATSRLIGRTRQYQ